MQGPRIHQNVFSKKTNTNGGDSRCGLDCENDKDDEGA